MRRKHERAKGPVLERRLSSRREVLEYWGTLTALVGLVIFVVVVL